MCQQLSPVRKEIFQFRSGPFELVGLWDFPLSCAPPYPAVLLCHGFTGHHVENRRLFSRLAQTLAKRGIAVLRFDHRGCGDSSGDFADFTPAGYLQDLENVEQQFWGHPKVDRNATAVVGYSLGGVSATYFAARHPELRTLVLWAGLAHPEIIKERLSQACALDGYKEGEFIDWSGWRVSRGYIEDLPAYVHPVSWISGYGGPVLFIHGDQDEVVPLTHSQSFLAGRCQEHDSLCIIEGGDHAFSSCQALDTVLSQTRRWIVDKLLLKLN